MYMLTINSKVMAFMYFTYILIIAMMVNNVHSTILRTIILSTWRVFLTIVNNKVHIPRATCN